MIIEKICQSDLYANIYYKEKKKKYTPVIIWGGSEGGIWFADMIAKRLAEDNFICMSLAYFNFENLPKKLNRIKIEYFLNAIDFLQKHKQSTTKKINIIGISRGAEAALFVGTLRADIGKIVAPMPSNTMNEALPTFNNIYEPAWNFNNKDILPYDYDIFQTEIDKGKNIIAKENVISNAQSVIPIEKINSEVLLISAGKDKLWNSSLMAKLLVRRSKRIKKIDNKINLIHYKNAGHFGFGVPESKLTQKEIDFCGGTLNATNRAKAHSWEYMIKFFRNSL